MLIGRGTICDTAAGSRGNQQGIICGQMMVMSHQYSQTSFTSVPRTSEIFRFQSRRSMDVLVHKHHGVQKSMAPQLSGGAQIDDKTSAITYVKSTRIFIIVKIFKIIKIVRVVKLIKSYQSS